MLDDYTAYGRVNSVESSNMKSARALYTVTRIPSKTVTLEGAISLTDFTYGRTWSLKNLDVVLNIRKNRPTIGRFEQRGHCRSVSRVQRFLQREVVGALVVWLGSCSFARVVKGQHTKYCVGQNTTMVVSLSANPRNPAGRIKIQVKWSACT